MTEPRRWTTVPVIELSGWLGSEDTHSMVTPDGAPGIHAGTGPKPETCSICRDGCGWAECGEPPTEMLSSRVVTERPATLFEPAGEDPEPVTLLMCAEHAERVRTEPVAGGASLMEGCYGRKRANRKDACFQMGAKSKRGRRANRRMPEPIPDTPENIMRAIISTPPKADDDWRYLSEGGTGD